MTWVKLNDTAMGDPRFIVLPARARLLHIEALAYSNMYAGDGAVPLAALNRITDDPDAVAHADALVAAGLWAKTEHGYRVVWLLDDQPSPERIAAGREFHRKRQARYLGHKTGDHSDCFDWCRAGKALRDASSDESVTRSRPFPPRRKGGKGKSASAAAPSEGASASAPRNARPSHGHEPGPLTCASCLEGMTEPLYKVVDPKDGTIRYAAHDHSSGRDRCVACRVSGS